MPEPRNETILGGLGAGEAELRAHGARRRRSLNANPALEADAWSNRARLIPPRACSAIKRGDESLGQRYRSRPVLTRGPFRPLAACGSNTEWSLPPSDRNFRVIETLP
jgi:hypothetical protein